MKAVVEIKIKRAIEHLERQGVISKTDKTEVFKLFKNNAKPSVERNTRPSFLEQKHA